MKIWAFIIPLYWIIALCSPTLANSPIYPTLMRAQILLVLIAILPYLSGELLLITLISIYYYASDIFYSISGTQHVIETCIFFSWWVWLKRRFIVEMMKFRGLVVEKHFLYSPCLCIIKELLALIGPEYSPSSLRDFIPSFYLRKVLKNGRKKNR